MYTQRATEQIKIDDGKVIPPYEKDYPTNWGGPRENAGRDEVSDRKQQVYVGIKTSEINLLGGKKEVQRIMLEAIGSAVLVAKEKGS